ncbi:MAG: glycosyltransferase family 9 protein [Flavobacteriales bacterium]
MRFSSNFRSAIFLGAGIGNTLFLIPLAKEILKQGSLYGIATSSFDSEAVLEGFNERLFSRVIKSRSKLQLILKMLPFVLKQLDVVYLDYFSATRFNLVVSSMISRKIITNHIPENLPNRFKRKIEFVHPIPGLHEGAQYLRFIDRGVNDSSLSEANFKLTANSIRSMEGKPYITIQPGAGNNLTPWKIWPLRFWAQLIQLIQLEQPALRILILGDSTEYEICRHLAAASENVDNRCGLTTISDLPVVIGQSRLHIGGDSGLLHVAGVLGIPSICIAGGSDPEIYGWHKINAQKHAVIRNKLDCHPCYRWYLPNKTRVTNPQKCPDYKCIQSISPETVFECFKQRINHAG